MIQMKTDSFKRVVNSIEVLKERRPLITIEFAFLLSEVVVLPLFIFDKLF